MASELSWDSGNPDFFLSEMFQLFKHWTSQRKHAYWPHPGHRLPVCMCVWSLFAVPAIPAAQAHDFEEGERRTGLHPRPGMGSDGCAHENWGLVLIRGLWWGALWLASQSIWLPRLVCVFSYAYELKSGGFACFRFSTALWKPTLWWRWAGLSGI